MAERFDVVVIGGGTAGLVTASGCTRLGRKVAMIEREALGGDCLWTGCVPTKALVASAKLAHQMRNAAAFGLEPVAPRVSPKSVMDSMREQRRIISRHDDPEKFRKLGIDVIEGDARISGAGLVEVGNRTLQAKDIVIATGARTAVPPVEGLKESGFLDHVSFLKQDEFPASILILGGGYIGIEFAQMFARFGSRVTVVEMSDEIINKEDTDVIARVRDILTNEGIELLTGWAVKSVRREGAKKIARVEQKNGTSREITIDEVFVASGRRGNTENLGLESVGVQVEKSWIVVDRYLQTTAPRIWAIGDVHGGLQFTHVAAYEAVKLVRNMLFPGKSAVDYTHIPWALYTDPEVGHIGLTEAEARQKHGDAVRTYQVPMADVDRAVVDRTTLGLLKIVCDSKGAILGAHALCANASTVIEEIVLARRKGMKVSDLAQRISSYPSLADGVQKAASLYYQDVAGGWLGALGKKVASWSQ
ncbi:MAG TPA: FAD-dependent oxidoreductase [Thermoanaerobaculia bacterium]|jgi:pyruvate/2-oxoglutarate dehydrogenase complex dihydrolipoamide dehydrogenase (E3) component|nr:FAD-dependent oxidoreductase [Thermoanaerobaculia bacterium]